MSNEYERQQAVIEELRRKERALMSDTYNAEASCEPFSAFCAPRAPSYPYAAESLRDEVNRQRAKAGLAPLAGLPSYTAAADNGDRARRTDAKVSDPVSKTSVRAHSHYFRDVSKLTDLDVYRICDLFVDDRSGATQHALKKILLPGQRGGKDRMKDYQEAVDTLNRKIEMMKEDVK